jgi:hypothetical protein
VDVVTSTRTVVGSAALLHRLQVNGKTVKLFLCIINKHCHEGIWERGDVA